ncbi:MAG: sigma-70 family RNA polymerase sigma factor [Propionivibrio sp.]
MTRAALAQDLEKIRPTLLRFAMLQLRNQALAEDVVQETMLAALEGKSEFSGRSQFKTWAVSILRNKIVDHLRRSSREGPLPMVDDQGDADFDALFAGSGHWQEKPTEWGDPADVLEQHGFYDVLELCLQALPENIARVFTMREVLGFETAEICKELKISTSNCWVVLYRARMRLRECLQLRWFDAR